ncbi:hypothetical protein BH09BAC3_BH09BAC3_19120 [soil metagenome]
MIGDIKNPKITEKRFGEVTHPLLFRKNLIIRKPIVHEIPIPIINAGYETLPINRKVG